MQLRYWNQLATTCMKLNWLYNMGHVLFKDLKNKKKTNYIINYAFESKAMSSIWKRTPTSYWQLIVEEGGWEGDNIITWAWAFAQGDNIGFIDELLIKSQHAKKRTECRGRAKYL
jgi:hypothetical protein